MAATCVSGETYTTIDKIGNHPSPVEAREAQAVVNKLPYYKQCSVLTLHKDTSYKMYPLLIQADKTTPTPQVIPDLPIFLSLQEVSIQT